jgi:hypothetical protein
VVRCVLETVYVFSRQFRSCCRDDKCFVCQAFANDLEERIALHRSPGEAIFTQVIQNTCDRLVRGVIRL